MDDELEQLKSVLRSLVVSSPTRMDVRTLLRDYRNMIGAPVPLTKYGHKDPVEFLKERFSDCFLFSGPQMNPELTLIVPKSLKHIDKFVQKQNVPGKARWHPKRRSVPEEVVKPILGRSTYNTLAQTTQPSQTQELNRTVARETETVINKPNRPVSSPSVVTSNPNIANKQCETSKSKSNGNMDVPQRQTIVEDVEEIEHGLENNRVDSVRNFFKKRLPMYNSSQYLDEEQSHDKCDNDSGRNTSSSGNSAKVRKLEQLKCEIMKLISDAPNGVWCTDLIRLYRERYNREMNFTQFGFTSIISLVYCLEEGVQITRPVDTGDWLLQELQRAAPAPAALRPRRPRVPLAHANHEQSTADPDDALPGIEFDSDVFPEDCMHFMEGIDSMCLGDFKPGAMVEVMVGEVYSPSHFWFLRLGDNYNIAMEDMMDEMTKYYNNEGRDRVLARGAVRVGHYCSSLYERDWHRSLIVKIVDSDTVKVRHVDYGTVDTVAIAALKPLRRAWARLPAQAARARLAGVRPIAAGWRWPHAAAAAFLALVSNRGLVANVVALDERDMVSEVLLIDTSSDEDVCIGTELIRGGHADSRPDSALRTLDVYLYPRFEALEAGDTPNYAEIHAYLRDGIRLDCVDAYRLHVPPVLPDARPAPPPPPDSDSSADCEPLSSRDHSLSTSDCVPSPPPPEPSPAPSVSAPERPSSEPSSHSPPPNATPSVSQPQLKPAATTEPPGPPQLQRPPLLPTPSYLSPHAPVYIPGASFTDASSATRQEYRAPRPGFPPQVSGPGYSVRCPEEYVRSPPPPYGGPAPVPPGASMSMAEWETYRLLSHVNPSAAHWFMVGAMGRMTVPVRPMPPMPPHHPSMYAPHSAMHPPRSYLQAPHPPMHPRGIMRPPPGYGN